MVGECCVQLRKVTKRGFRGVMDFAGLLELCPQKSGTSTRSCCQLLPVGQTDGVTQMIRASQGA
jgi:hypothetical protein